MKEICTLIGKPYKQEYLSTSTATTKFFNEILTTSLLGEYNHHAGEAKTVLLRKLFLVSPTNATRAGSCKWGKLTLSGLLFLRDRIKSNLHPSMHPAGVILHQLDQITDQIIALTETQQQYTDQLTETQQQITDQLTETHQQYTDQLTETRHQITDQLSQTQQQITDQLTQTQQQITDHFTQQITEVNNTVNNMWDILQRHLLDSRYPPLQPISVY